MWLLWNREDRTEDPEWTYDAILSGKQDAYFERMAWQIRYYNQPIKIRMMHELNTAQRTSDAFNYPWAASLKDADGNVLNTPDKAIDVWRYIVRKFDDVGADKVEWVYSVLVWPEFDQAGNPWNPVSFKSIYPGDAWVDVVGFDYYSFDVSNPVMPLADKNFKAMYDEVRVVTTKPLSLTEFGAFAKDGDPAFKPAWLSEVMGTSFLAEYPSIKSMYLWDSLWPNNFGDFSTTTDFSETPETLAATVGALKTSVFSGSIQNKIFCWNGGICNEVLWPQ
jgi:beta-mannanase